MSAKTSCSEPLKAPFPWFGGKSRAAEIIWGYFGDVANYVEPFAGSLAVLLARPHAPRIETVNDLDCFLANFWRAVAASPEEVARFADWPVNEADLHARHRWLVDRAEFRARMRAEPDYFDAKIAGWWVWGLSAWIGSGWCAKESGVPSHQLPPLSIGGMGVHAVSNRLRILDLLVSLSGRLRNARVACGDFERVLSDAVTWKHGTCAILLDPPYADGEEVYAEGGRSTFARVATWAAEHGADERLRICLCGYDGTWAPPAGWAEVPWKAQGGYGGQRKNGENVNAARERLWFSPGCLNPSATKAQGDLFAAGAQS
jgi:hypothetical protein